MSEKTKRISRIILTNTIRFGLILGFVLGFAALFGQTNVLAGVALVVGLLMFPVCDLGLRPGCAALLILALYPICGIVASLPRPGLLAGMLIDFIFVCLLMVLFAEPAMLKPHINFLLCFLFCRSAPVAGRDFILRILGLIAGGTLIAAAMLIFQKRAKNISQRRTLRAQIDLCISNNRAFILRMAIGIALAIAAGEALHLKKSLWITIVVMSLTQPAFCDAVQRIRHRVCATVVGIALFTILFDLLIPQQYATVGILLLGYCGSFTSAYQHVQTINAVSAITASLVLLDSTTAVWNRAGCLAGGIVIVLLLYTAQRACGPLAAYLRKQGAERIQWGHALNGTRRGIESPSAGTDGFRRIYAGCLIFPANYVMIRSQ